MAQPLHESLFEEMGKETLSQISKTLSAVIASYGINNWVYDPPIRAKKIQGRPTAWNWRTFDVPDPTETPLFLDAMWRGGGPGDQAEPPAFNGEWIGRDAEMHHFVMKRHGKGVNMLFFDGSARPEPVRHLWQLPWHRQYDIQRAMQTQFPSWMDE
jgi:prepilin-type processing-associated H-X9-DG protein